MSFFEACILGLVQGLTEFFPISSSAHIKLIQLLLGVEPKEGQILFDLTCHLGTLIAILFFLKEEVLLLFNKDKERLFRLFCATIPLIPCYFLLKPLRDFAAHPHCLGYCLMLTSLILFTGQRFRLPKTLMGSKHKAWSDILWIGTVQSLALIPGISRSASTISCAKVLGWHAKEAVRFSFLLSIPTIIGGNLLELFKLGCSHNGSLSLPFSTCLIGFFASLIGGLTVVRFAFAFLEKGDLKPFAWYCLGLGICVTVALSR